MKDLNTAIELSKGAGRSACQAYIQRALIHRLRSQEEEAKKDFKSAADLGSEYAKNQVPFFRDNFRVMYIHFWGNVGSF